MRINIVDNKDAYKSQYRLAISNFVMEFINFIPELINAILANSILVWADTFSSLESTVHYFIVSLATRQMIKDDGNKYNYGLDRLEIMISFICDLFLIIGYLVIVLISITQLRSPERPSDAIAIFLLLKVVNIAADVFFYVQAKLVQKKHPSRLNESEVANLGNDLVEDIVMGILVSICFFFRSDTWSWYVSPAASIVFAIVFSISAVKRLHGSFSEISDVSAKIEEQDEIFDILLEYPSYFDRIEEVNCHFLNHKLLVDIKVIFKEHITYAQQTALLQEISAKAKKTFPDASLRFVIENEN